MHFKYTFYLLLLALLNPVLWGLYIIDYSEDEHYRFANSDKFIGSGYNFSGVGMNLSYEENIVQSNGLWATMISSNVFITCNHWYPGTGTTMTFWEDNDYSSSITRTVSTQGTRIGETDLWLGTLDQALPSNYAYYNIPSDFEDTFDKNNTVFSVGIHHEIVNDAVSDRIEFVVANSQRIFSPTPEEFYIRNDYMGYGIQSFYYMGNDEDAHLQGGDSGAPIFLFDNNVLRLLGISSAGGPIHFYIDENGNKIYDRYLDLSVFHESYFMDLNSYNTEINNYLALHAIPEPATILGVLPIAIFGMFRFLRKRAEQKDSNVIK